MPDILEAVRFMKVACAFISLGYDQGNRWDIRDGGECDCSSLVITALRHAGFDTGAATYTGNMRRELTARGWAVVATYPQSSAGLQPGDILLNDTNHVALWLGDGVLGQASIDERGNITGGQAGDQTGNETNIRGFYVYWDGWDAVLRYAGGNTVASSYEVAEDPYNPNGYGEGYVREVQTLLIAAGYDIGPAGIDGILGAKTHFAVMAFQNANDLQVDGIPGPETMSRLRGQTGSVAQVRAVDGQELLVVDGIPGPATYARFQQVMGTPIDGVKDEPSAMVCAFQAFLNTVVAPGQIRDLTGAEALEVDGYDGPKTWLVYQYWVWNVRNDIVAAYAPGWGVWDWCDGDDGGATWKSVQHALNESWAGSGRLLGY